MWTRLTSLIPINKHKLLGISVLVFVIGGILGGTLWHYGGVYVDPPFFPGPSPLNQFTSYQELVTFINTSSQYYPMYSVLEDAVRSMSATSESNDYSTTNIQVEGVDEADWIKTDGTFLYVVTGSNLSIIHAYPPEEAEILCTLQLNQSITGMFVNGDKLVVIQGGFDGYEIFYRYSPYLVGDETTIHVYDVTDRASPTLERTLTLDGTYLNSRMIGDHVYALVRKPAYLNDSDVELPEITVDEQHVEVPATTIYYVNASDTYHVFTTVIALNVQDVSQDPSHETFLLGATSNLYVSQQNLYITAMETADFTTIHRIWIDAANIAYTANGQVPGRVLNQFSMDEYQGSFRIATTQGEAWSSDTPSRSNVYILNSNLTTIGKLEGLAPGEQIYSARFMAEKCYLVTFKKIDPLFVIDLSDVENPTVLGELKIPGYSDYLHPYGATHLIGVGKETEEAEEGDFAWYQGVKISLFDVSDVSNPLQVANITVGHRGTDSPALRDHKAFLFDEDRELLVIPILVAEIDASAYSGDIPAHAYGDPVWQGAYVFDVSIDGELEVRGRISHLEPGATIDYDDWPYFVERTLYIEDTLYTVSGKKIVMNSLVSLELLNELQLP